jgi:hypothetical protein
MLSQIVAVQGTRYNFERREEKPGKIQLWSRLLCAVLTRYFCHAATSSSRQMSETT